MELARVSEMIRTREISPVEVVSKLLEDIERLNPVLNAYITISTEEALFQAKQVEAELQRGTWKGPLHGIPIALKDIIYTKGIRTTMGSKVYADFVPDFDAAVVERLTMAGAIIVGKLNTHEFAYGTTGDCSYFGPVRNPYDHSRVSGGSSSGAAAAVAAGLSYGAVGTDTAGSVRIPAACCGVVGMKPTFGRISRFGIFPLSDSVDHVGPLTKTVRDNALLLNAMVGQDLRDPLSISSQVEDFTRDLDADIRGKVIGVPTSYYYDGLETEIQRKTREAVRYLSDFGAEVRHVDLPDMKQFLSILMTIQQSESYAVHVDTIRDHQLDVHPEILEKIVAGRDIRAYDYVLAKQQQRIARHQLEQALRSVDAILTPTTTILPPKIGQKEIEVDGVTRRVHSQMLRLTAPSNLTGHPSLTVPFGLSSSGLPIGMQLIGRMFTERTLYQVGHTLEKNFTF